MKTFLSNKTKILNCLFPYIKKFSCGGQGKKWGSSEIKWGKLTKRWDGT